jgi:hypothetical protein
MTTSQINAVFQAVCSVLDKTSFDSAVELSKEERNNVVNIVTEGILANKVDFSTEAKAKYNTSKPAYQTATSRQSFIPGKAADMVTASTPSFVNKKPTTLANYKGKNYTRK